MKTKLFRWISCLCAVVLIAALFCGVGASAATDKAKERYTNPDTGFRVWILDDQDLLTDSGESDLLQQMIPITQYGDVIFWSTGESTYNEIEQAKIKRQSLCRNNSSCILEINTGKRKVTFQSDGAINRIVSASYARSVTDNASGRASSGDYYGCAVEVYSEVLTLLQGNRIAEPMKYISFVVIGLMLSFVLVVAVVFGRRFNPLIKKNKDQVLLQGQGMLFVTTPNARIIGSSPRGWVIAGQIVLEILLSALSSGGGGGRSGGGGSGGGGGGGSGGSSSY